MKFIFFIAFSILLNQFASAQATFERSYTCQLGADEAAYSIKQTFDGGNKIENF